MPNNLHEHLDLPMAPNMSAKKRRRGVPLCITPRKRGFTKTQIVKLNKISDAYTKLQTNTPNYSQDLVFKIKTTQKVHDETFRNNLHRENIDTLVSNPGENAEWIVTTTDPSFSKLKKKLEKRKTTKYPTFIDGIKTFDEFLPEDRLGDVLKKDPLAKQEVAKLVISLVKIEGTDNIKLEDAIRYICQIVTLHGFNVLDKLITDYQCRLLIKANKETLQEILKIDTVIEVDRDRDFVVGDIAGHSLGDIQIESPPSPDAHGILVMDSGIIRHPLMIQSLNEAGIVGLPDRTQKDDRDHGTKVAGMALFGNIEEKLSQNQPLKQEVRIFSAKIFYQYGRQTIRDDRLLDSLIHESLEKIRRTFPKCKVINLSFGYDDNVMSSSKRQFELAAVIDDLAFMYKDMIFVISVGNIPEGFIKSHAFPDYLVNKVEDTGIVNPSTSIHAVSVGALQKDTTGVVPSDITRIGPGLNDMIKPDLVEIGGGSSKPIVVLNPDFKTRPLARSMGTSFSTPIVANHLARLMNKFPKYSRNMIKALLISSAKLPEFIPDVFPKLNSVITNLGFLRILSVYGYGRPEPEGAMYSTDDMVVLHYEGKIKIDHVKYFTIHIPPEFACGSGKRKISVTLVYDPPTRPHRAQYMGVLMESHLIRNHNVENVSEKYGAVDFTRSEIDTRSQDDRIPTDLSSDEIKLKPGTRLRKKSPHQSAFTTLTSRYKIDDSKPLVLAVVCQKAWDMNADTEQDFAVVVKLEHSEKIDLYSKVMNLNKVQTSAKPRIRV